MPGSAWSAIRPRGRHGHHRYFFFVALFANVLAPHNPLKMNSGKGYLPPVWIPIGPDGDAPDPRFLLGTDTLGRDVLSRVICTARGYP